MTLSPSEPSTPRRRPSSLHIATVIARTVAILPLGGCFNMQTGITISGDDRVSGTIHVTPTEEVRSQSEQWQIPDDSSGRVSQGVVDSSIGKMEVSLNELHFIELTDTLRQLSDDRIDIDPDRTGDGKISMNGHMDLTHLPGAKADSVVTFPEQVTDSNGRRTEPNRVKRQLASDKNHNVWVSPPTGSIGRNQLLLLAGATTTTGVLASVLGVP